MWSEVAHIANNGIKTFNVNNNIAGKFNGRLREGTKVQTVV
jgi:hypothetical protein